MLREAERRKHLQSRDGGHLMRFGETHPRAHVDRYVDDQVKLLQIEVLCHDARGSTMLCRRGRMNDGGAKPSLELQSAGV